MTADLAALPVTTLAEQDSAIAAAFRREGRRLRGFIRRRVADACDAEHIVQDVFSELIEATPPGHADRERGRLARGWRPTDHRSVPRKSTVSLDPAPAAGDVASEH